MAQPHRIGPGFRLANAVMTALLRRGAPAGGNVLLTVPGRKSGRPRSTRIPIAAPHEQPSRHREEHRGERSQRASGRDRQNGRGHGALWKQARCRSPRDQSRDTACLTRSSASAPEPPTAPRWPIFRPGLADFP